MPGDVPPVVAAQLFDLGSYLVDDILTKVDRASMATGVEVRVPWLDHLLVEQALRIDHALTFRRSERKHILKKAVAGLLPAELLTGRKKGFGFPLSAWLDKEWREQAGPIVSHGSLVAEGIFDSRVAESIMRTGSSEWCWLIFCAELWSRRWLHGGTVPDLLAAAGVSSADRFIHEHTLAKQS